MTPRRILVTGAAGNLGRALAARFAADGDRLLLADLRPDALRDARPAGSHELVAVDLTRPDEVDRLLAPAIAAFGGLDVVCNVAGGFRMGSRVHETSPVDWEAMLALNATSVVNVARAVVPALRGSSQAAIVNVAAAAATTGKPLMGAYCASKSVVVRLTEGMAAELKAEGIRVNCVLPGIIDTPENRRAMPGADAAQWVAPGDLARVIAFLASAEARAITGACIPVTGLA